MADILIKKTNSHGKHLVTPDIINVIKLFTGELHIRKGKYVKVNRIPNSDYRYTILKKRPLIRQVHNTDVLNHPLRGCVWFKVNGKFMVIYSGKQHVWMGTHYYDGYLTEMHYNNYKLINPIL